MNITELRYLVAIMKWGSVSAAAKQLYAAQPNVSKALKNLDMVIANNLKVDGAGFGTDTNVITMITKTDCTEFPKMSKFEVAGCIFDAIIKNMKARRTDEK